MRTRAKSLCWVYLVLSVFGAIAFGPRANADTFTWDRSPDEATGKVVGYKFYYSAQSFTSIPADVTNNPAFTIITVGTNQPTVTVNNLVSGQTYFMTVTAFGTNDQQSLPSNILSYTTGAPIVAITSPATNATVLTTDTVTVTATASG